MKRFWMAVVILAIVFGVQTISVYAEETAPKASAESAADKEEAAKKRAEIRKAQQEKQKELNGTQWDVRLESKDPKAKLKEDVLSFQNNQFKSKNNTERGFTPTNYTITVPEGGESAVFETMQTGPKSEVIFVRGEWKKDSMTGAISEQMEAGQNVEYWFSTKGKKAVATTTDSIEWDPSLADAQDENEPLVSKEAKKTKKSSSESDPAPKAKGKLVA